MSFTFGARDASLRLALVGALLRSPSARKLARRNNRRARRPLREATGSPTVAAAASLRYALDEIAKRFEKETGKSVKITFGATGSLVHQIEAGAPFQALFAADDASVKKLAKAGKTEGDAHRLRARRAQRRRAEGFARRHRRRSQGAEGRARRRQGEACRHRQSRDGALWPRRAGNVDEGRAVGRRCSRCSSSARTSDRRRRSSPPAPPRSVSSPSRWRSPRRSRRRSTPPSCPTLGTSRSTRHGGHQRRFGRCQGVRRFRTRPARSRGPRGERLLRADVLI